MADEHRLRVEAALRDLDHSIAAMESSRTDCTRQLATAHGLQAEALAVTLKKLDDTLAAARAKRTDVLARAARATRMSEIATEMRTIRHELEALAAAADRGPRYTELRNRALELQAEAEKLRMGSP
jgi:hypothetical protein